VKHTDKNCWAKVILQSYRALGNTIVAAIVVAGLSCIFYSMFSNWNEHWYHLGYRLSEWGNGWQGDGLGWYWNVLLGWLHFGVPIVGLIYLYVWAERNSK